MVVHFTGMVSNRARIFCRVAVHHMSSTAVPRKDVDSIARLNRCDG